MTVLCPACGSETKVDRTRRNGKLCVERVRYCVQCPAVLRTIERHVGQTLARRHHERHWPLGDQINGAVRVKGAGFK